MKNLQPQKLYLLNLKKEKIPQKKKAGLAQKKFVRLFVIFFYFPTQKLANMLPNTSSGVTSPVTSPKKSKASSKS